MAPEVFRDPTDPGAFRDLMGRFASGAVVLSASTEAGPVGVTCQSFFSQSLTPPMVAASMSLSSSTLPALLSTGRFAVSILSASQHRLARQFGTSGIDRWADVPWRQSPAGDPWIGGALAWMDCTIAQTCTVGDHTVLFGSVERAEVSEHGHPLILFRGSPDPVGFMTQGAVAV